MKQGVSEVRWILLAWSISACECTRADFCFGHLGHCPHAVSVFHTPGIYFFCSNGGVYLPGPTTREPRLHCTQRAGFANSFSRTARMCCLPDKRGRQRGAAIERGIGSVDICGVKACLLRGASAWGRLSWHLGLAILLIPRG